MVGRSPFYNHQSFLGIMPFFFGFCGYFWVKEKKFFLANKIFFV